jgi:hypothetical protein
MKHGPLLISKNSEVKVDVLANKLQLLLRCDPVLNPGHQTTQEKSCQHLISLLSKSTVASL